MASCDNILPYIKPGWVGAEIGVQWGISAVAFLVHGVRFMYLVDPWKTYDGYGAPSPQADEVEEANFRRCRDTLSTYDNSCRYYAILRMPSEEAARFIPNDLDFVWVDGNHGYHWVKDDLWRYWPKIRPGGVLCGHDYGLDPMFDVNRAVNEFAGGGLLALGNMCWVIQK